MAVRQGAKMVVSAKIKRRDFLQKTAAMLSLGALPVSLPSMTRARVDIAAILDQGLNSSRAMDYASSLADGIGARLTGSSNMARAYDWALVQMQLLGLDNICLEPVPIEVMGWQHVETRVRMATPATMDFMAQAGPWSRGTKGLLQAGAVAVVLSNDEDLERFRGQLGGKIVLLGPMRDVPANTRPLTERYTDEEVLSGSINAPVRAYYRNRAQRQPIRAEQEAFARRLQAFLEAEGVAGVLLPSRDGAHGGGSGTLSIDDSPFAPQGWREETRPAFPFAYVAIEHFGRAWRLLSAGQPVQLVMAIEVEETPSLQPVWNVVGDFLGTDPSASIVVAGAHLDSWSSGTGALDNASGVANVLEAVRILKAVGFKPRRTVRVVLFGAEEQGLWGAREYVRKHLEQTPHAIMFNMDGGAGRARAVFSGGDSAVAARFVGVKGALTDLGVLSVYDEPFWPADQSVFSEAGVPGIMFLQDPLDYFTRARHSNMDTMERMPPQDMAQLSSVLAVFIASEADR